MACHIIQFPQRLVVREPRTTKSVDEDMPVDALIKKIEQARATYEARKKGERYEDNRTR